MMTTLEPTTLEPTTLHPVDIKETIDMSNTKSSTVDGRAEAMFQSLFAGQLEAMARQMASKFNIDADAAVKMATEHASSIDLKQVAKPKRKSTKSRKPKVPITAENRCMARVWGTGSGNDQCKCARGEKSDYCSRHGKQAAICEKACQVTENGKKLGLFCGRIDQFHEQTNLAPFMVGSEIRIEWNSLAHKEAICDGIENDTIHHRKKKEKKKQVVATVEVDEEQMAAIVSGINDTTPNDKVVNDVADDSIMGIDDINLDIDTGAEESKVSVAEASRRSSIAGHQARIEVLQEMNSLENVDEDEEESLDVEEWEHQGNSYLVCRETMIIYNEEGEEIGKWGEGTTAGAPIPEE